MSTEIVVDSKELTQFAKDIVAAKRALLGKLDDRGVILLRDEVPRDTKNLWQGVSPGVVDYENMTAVLTVTGRSGATLGGIAEVFNAKGERVKTVSLRPQPAYNYAEVVARGNRQARLSPTHAKAFLIPVSSVAGEGYMLIGGQKYVLRTSRRGQPPNPYDERAAARLSQEAPAIAEAVLRKFV